MNHDTTSKGVTETSGHMDGSLGACDIAVRNMTIDQAIAVERKNIAYCLRQRGEVR
jgi:hypothetical protein